MTGTSNDRTQSAFSRWLRTGGLPSVHGPDGTELKFNPWHDPADGRFTFAGSGRNFGAGGADPASGSRNRASGPANRHRSHAGASSKTGRPRTGSSGADDPVSAKRRPVEGQSGHAPESQPENRPNPVVEFVGGVGEGLYDVGKGTVTGVAAALTTNPVTTIRNASHGIAGMIDTAIAAEDTPARVQMSRAADAVANASARDIGRATGSVAGNVAVAAAPGAALSKVSALRRLRMAMPRTTYDPPQIVWVKETLKETDEAWRVYNDSATGGRPGQAPTLIRTMPDGSKRPVKFDGVDSGYVIDRKWKIVNTPKGRAQLLRQSEVLAQHRLIGIWEVPNPLQKEKAYKMLKRMNVTNIKVRIVKP